MWGTPPFLASAPGPGASRGFGGAPAPASEGGREGGREGGEKRPQTRETRRFHKACGGRAPINRAAGPTQGLQHLTAERLHGPPHSLRTPSVPPVPAPLALPGRGSRRAPSRPASWQWRQGRKQLLRSSPLRSGSPFRLRGLEVVAVLLPEGSPQTSPSPGNATAPTSHTEDSHTSVPFWKADLPRAVYAPFFFHSAAESQHRLL